MTKYLDPSFSVALGSEDYRNGWERTFGKKAEVEALTQKSEVKGWAAEEVIMIGLVNSNSCKVCSSLYHFNGVDPGCPTCSKGSEP